MVKLYLDDARTPSQSGYKDSDWFVVRNYADLIKDGNIDNLESLGEVSEVKKFKQALHGGVISFIRPLLLKLD